MREDGCRVIDILETGCWILYKHTHLNTQRPLQETLLRNHKQKIFSSNPLRKWVNKVKVADWKIPGDIKKTFSSADLLGNESSRVVFNIAGNKYRLIAKYYFGDKQIHLFICWLGTHAAYTRICKQGKQYLINIY